MKKVMLAIFWSWMIYGCNAATTLDSKPASAETSAKTESAVEPTVEWYMGGAEISGPDGQNFGTSEAMCRRRLFPAQSLLIEQVVSFERSGEAKEYVTAFNINGNKFKMVEANGSFTGIGELEGKPWQWNHWHSLSTLAAGGDLPAGSTVDSDDRKTEDGGFIAVKEVRLPDGALIVKITERYKSVSEAEYMARYNQLFP